MVAFREQEPQEVCVVCSELTSLGCLRCGKPLCEKHRAAKNRRRLVADGAREEADGSRYILRNRGKGVMGDKENPPGACMPEL